MRQVNCYIPIKVCITGSLSATQLDELGDALIRAIAARMQQARSTLREHGHAHLHETVAPTHERFDPARSSNGRYGLPSYDKGGETVTVPVTGGGGAPVSPGAAQRQPSDAFEDAGPERPSSDFYVFREVMMTADPDFMMGELRRLIRRHGIMGGDFWYDALQGRGRDIELPFSAYGRAFGGQRVRTPIDLQREMQDQPRRDKLSPIAVPLAIRLYPVVRKEATDFLIAFRNGMALTLETLLKESEARIDTERVLYGITRDGKGYQAQNTVAFQALVGAAKDLLEIRTRIDDLKDQQRQLLAVPIGLRGMGGPGPYLPEDKKARHEELGRQIAALEEDYSHARTAAALRHPALGAILDDAGLSNASATLKRLASGELKSAWFAPGTAGMIGEILDSRQASIDKVRAKIAADPEKLWNLPSIVALTRLTMNTRSKTMADKLVDDKLAELKFDEEIRGLFLGVVALVLAIPTGGGSLAVGTAVAGATISAYQAIQSVQNYQLEEALASTDLDKRAYAIASEEPSLFWVALDVVFAIADGKAALKAFRSLKTEARAALTAAEGADAIEAEGRLVKSADAIEGVEKSKLGQRLRDTLARLRKGSPEARALGGAGRREAEAVAHAAEAIAKEAKSAETIGYIAGHEVKVTKSGHLVICTECTWLRERFAPELAADKELLARIETAEKAAKAGPLTPAAKAEIERLARDLQTVQKARVGAQLGPQAAAALEKLNKEMDAMRRDYVSELRANPPLAADLARVESITDPALKSREMAALRKKLEEAPGLRIELTPKRVERLTKAERKKWYDLPGKDRTSLGKRYGYIVEELVRKIASGGRAKVLHYPLVDAKLIKSLEEEGGRVVITQGQLRGGKLRFDIAEIDFKRKRIDLLDLTPSSAAEHIEKTESYAAELHRLTGFKVYSAELLYVGEDGLLLDELKEIKVGK
jgi:hypothetical protein